MGRSSGTKIDLQASLDALDVELSRPELRVSTVKALETKIQVLSELLKREQDNKQDAVAQENIQLKERLTPFEGLNLEEIGSVKEELRTTKAQLENTRNCNSSYSREAVTAKGEIENLKSMLRWMCEQVSPDARLKIAVRCFSVKHVAGRPVIDFLPGNDTTSLWLKNTHSKTVMAQKVRDLKHSVDADDKALVSFLLLYAKEKYQWDIEAQLKAEAVEQSRRENEADRQRGETQQAMEIARNKRMRENSRELEIIRTEAGLEPVSRVTPDYI
jgi:hypothetical protein